MIYYAEEQNIQEPNMPIVVPPGTDMSPLFVTS